jgi:Protein of unknown function (DUF1580)
MSADLLSENRLSLTELAKEQRVATSSVWRWTLRGIKGHRLEAFNLGGRKFTTRDAFARFLAAINGEKLAASATPRQREAAQNLVEEELDAILDEQNRGRSVRKSKKQSRTEEPRPQVD